MFFHEALHAAESRFSWRGLDIAVPRMRAVGLDPEDDERALLCRLHAGPYRAHEDAGIGDHVIRWREQNERLRVFPRSDQGGDASRGSGVAAHRFEHDVFCKRADLLELLGDEEPVAMIGKDEKIAEEGT